MDERHYLILANEELSRNLTPQAQQTQARLELAHLLETIQQPDGVLCKFNCLSNNWKILGCTKDGSQLHPVWLEQWLLLRQQGIPNQLRIHEDFIVWLCANCRLLERSKRHGRLTAWVREASKVEHKAPKWVRSYYDVEFVKLTDYLMHHRGEAQRTKARMLEYVAHDTWGIGDMMVQGPNPGLELINIDSTLLKAEGKITMAWWIANKEFPLL